MRILLWWLVLTALGAAVVPFVARLFAGFPDRGVAFARPLAIAILGLVAWLLGSLGVPYGAALVVTLVLFAAGAVGGARRFGAWPVPRSELVRAEAAFALGLLFFAGIRALRPEIFGAEKYMDFAFFNAILRTHSIPPEDPWLAGAPINYYYFGYLLFANLARISGIAPEVAYNLSLATIGAVLFSGAISIGRALSANFAFGALGGLAVAVLGNLDGALQMWVDGRGLGNLDYWRSSRVVEHTINEFPFFSLLHGDLHPHVTALLLEVPLVALLVAVATSSATALPRAPLAVAIAVLAAVGLTNPWDLPLAIALLALVCVRRTWAPSSPLRSLLPTVGTIAAAVGGILVVALPFVRHFDAPLGGVGLVHAHTSAADAFVVFGILGTPIALALAAAALGASSASEGRTFLIAASAFVATLLAVFAKSPVLGVSTIALETSLFVLVRDRSRAATGAALVALAAVAIGLCEIVYLRDPYGADLHRMNTVFKFYFQAWVYAALAWPAMLAIATAHLPIGLRRNVGTALLWLLVGSGLVYPAAAIATFAPGAPRPLTLDGLVYLDRDHRDDARAIRWLRDHAEDRRRVLEATGDAYSYFGRVSSNTGIPTLLGWANHENVWRGADARVGERGALVRRLYEERSSATAASLLAEHRVRYVFVGELERKTYPAEGLAKFANDAAAFTEVFRSGGTAVYAVNAAREPE
jgi:YYY domain-containing protein